MKTNRKAAEEFILKFIKQLSTDNVPIYENFFKSMSDKQFEDFMLKLKNKETTLFLVLPNLSKNRPTVSKNIQIYKQLGFDFFQKVWIDNEDGTPRHLTNHKYLVMKLPIRRQAQLLEKKIGVASNNKVIDQTTGQPTGDSKGARLTFPEIQVLSAQGLEHSLEELLKYRGGDLAGQNALNASLLRSGGASMANIDAYSGDVKSTKTLSTMLKCMHIENNL